MRLLRIGRAVGEILETDSSRRTPNGELLFETFISPSSSSIKKTAPAKGKPSYQMFGLHSSNTADTVPETKAPNGFHSFDYLIVKENETTPRQAQSVPKLNETSGGELIDGRESEKKRKFGTAFILLCLISALIFLTCLAFVSYYFLTEQQRPPASPVIRETSTAITLATEKDIALLTENAGQFSVRKNIQTKERQAKI
jgi:hypothetical protein